MRRFVLLGLSVGMALVLSACGQAVADAATAELGSSDRSPEAYMYDAASGELLFWCDEFAAEMLRRGGVNVYTNGVPSSLAFQFPVATPPYQPGDLVFVTYPNSHNLYDHVGILQRAEGDHLWVVDGNWPTGDGASGVVLNERWIGDGAVTEIRRP